MSESAICAEIASSCQFDFAWYLAAYPDVARSGMDPLLHYVRYGEKEGRKPRPDFNPREYIPLANGSGNRFHDHLCPPSRKESGVEEIPVVFAVNRNYLPYLSVALASLACNADIGKFYNIRILTTELESGDASGLVRGLPENIAIKLINVSDRVAEIKARAWLPSYLTVETYFRILIPSLFGEYKKVLYLDADIAILRDVAELYRQDIGSAWFAAAEDRYREPKFWGDLKKRLPPYVDKYYNAGVMLFNNRTLQSDGVYAKFLAEMAKGVEWPCADQDIMNVISVNKVYPLGAEWNCQWHYYLYNAFRHSSQSDFKVMIRAYRDPAIIHYSSDKKPWKYDDGHFSGVWWSYARYSHFLPELIKQCPYQVNYLRDNQAGI